MTIIAGGQNAGMTNDSPKENRMPASCHSLRIGRTSVQFLFLLTVLGAIANAQCVDYNMHPHWVAGASSAGGAWGIAVKGDHVLVTTDTDFQVFDTKNIQSPGLVGSTHLPSSGGRIALRGRYAYVADFNAGLIVVDVAVPTEPAIVGSSYTIGRALGICCVGDFLYVSTADQSNPSNSRLEVFSVAENPITPTRLASVEIGAYGWDIAVEGDMAYIAAGNGGLVLANVSDPANPEMVRTLYLSRFAFGVVVDGTNVWIAADCVFYVADVSNPLHPRVTGSVAIPSTGYAVANYSHYACIADYDQGVVIVDVLNPAAPRVSGHVGTPGFSYGIAVDRGSAFVADWNSMQVVWVSAIPEAVPVIHAGTAGIADDVEIKGSYAYIGDSGAGLTIESIDGGNPVIVGRCSMPGTVVGVTVDSSRAFAANGDLVVVDVTNPAAPFAIGSVTTPGVSFDVAVPDQTHPAAYAYVADASAGLQVVRVSSMPPVVVGSIHTGGAAHRLCVRGRFVFVADDHAGLVVVDVADPAHPVIVASKPTPPGAANLSLINDFACVVSDGGFYIIDISDPVQPVMMGDVTTRRCCCTGIGVEGTSAYVTLDWLGVEIIDFSDPTNPRIVGEFDTQGYASAAAVSNCRVYIADQDRGLAIAPAHAVTAEADHSPVPTPLWLAACPNPVRAGEHVRFEFPFAETIPEIDVYDATGRLIRRLAKTTPLGGSFPSWDCRDDLGRQVPSGTYYVRSAGRMKATSRVVLIR
jgi:hypothetical protein